MKNEPILVNTLTLLGMIQRCAKRANEQQDERLHASVDALLSALVAKDGLRQAFVVLPAAVRPHHDFACLNSPDV